MIAFLFTASATRILLWSLVAHLVADWLFQNHWMAVNKSNPHHAAGYVHALIHVVALLLVYPLWWVAFAVGVTHWLIDLRFPLVWWRAFYKQTTDPKNPASIHVSFWGDQVAHILILAVAAVLLGR